MCIKYHKKLMYVLLYIIMFLLSGFTIGQFTLILNQTTQN